MKSLPDGLTTPCFLVDEDALERNLRTLASVQERSGARVLLALKGFALWAAAPLIDRYLSGVCCSGLHEAMLGREKFAGEVHVYSPAFRDDEINDILEMADHLSFNSLAQWSRFRGAVAAMPDPPLCGLRVNPEHREVAVELYDPCAPFSRLGVTAANLAGREAELEGLSGLHFHPLCELNSDALQRTLDAVERRFAWWLPRVRWVNMGGGHHITRPDYDLDLLVRLISDFRARHGVDVYLEPGEAVGLNAGVLVATVLDVFRNGMDIAVLDTSATTHMPDVLEMPYRPRLVAVGPDGLEGGLPGERAHTYRLGGLSCLAGDVIGDYSFDRPLRPGDRLVFADMAHYTMVKTTTFNGVPLPSIALHRPSTGAFRVVRRFSYEDYRDRLS